ncbi:MAG: pyridoxal-phosphate dependent enzyme [Myxococcota bacterium]
MQGAHPFACPVATPDDDIDHVLVRRIDPQRSEFPPAPEGNPYLDFAPLMSAWHRASAAGMSEADFRAGVQRLDDAVAEVDGHGFALTPLRPAPELVRVVAPGIELWAKDETRNVSGSHKARHLMGVLIHLWLAETLGLVDAGQPRRPLAIASCGNAALAAAVLARAARWPLSVFVPEDADPAVLDRLRTLSADVQICPRDGQPGDPCYRAFRAALGRGALPFSVQGSDNGLAVEGGLTLGYELAHQVRRGPGRLDAVVVQVGGGALASACLHALRDAVAWGVLPSMPRLYTVQTGSAWPLRRAYERVAARLADEDSPPADPREHTDGLRARPPEAIDEVLRYAATHRHEFMWPWEQVPHSVAHGILDDETYDWWALVDGMIRTGGRPLTVDESTLTAAHQAVRSHTSVRASATGTAGVAGLMQLHREGGVRSGEVVGVLLTGCER